jgi:hypothetical protein
MRAFKVLMLTATLAASLVVGVAGASDAASAKTVTHSTRWCC